MKGGRLSMINAQLGNEKFEKINGVIYSMSPSANWQHGTVNGNIYRIISTGLRNTLCRAFMENLDYVYHPDTNDDYVIPDIMIICDRKQLKGSSYVGVPKFIVETLSPGTSMRDLTTKKDIYESSGVNEYWIISPKEKAIQIYYLEDNKYALKYSDILETNNKDKQYNAKTKIKLRDFPIDMMFEEIFEGID